MRRRDGAASWSRDAAVLMVGMVVALAWDASGFDLRVARMLADTGGFALRDAWLARDVLHDGARWIAALALALLALEALSPLAPLESRAHRLRWLGVIVVTLVLVPLLKRFSLTSCPWDLAEFGGAASYVTHWRAGVADGGPGHCFPAGHPVAAFAFIGVYYRWRVSKPRRAIWLLVLVMSAGTVLGMAQVMRGAHFVSHVLWSAWFAAAITISCAAASARWRAPCR